MMSTTQMIYLVRKYFLFSKFLFLGFLISGFSNFLLAQMLPTVTIIPPSGTIDPYNAGIRYQFRSSYSLASGTTFCKYEWSGV